ncbi:hypothetical protein HY947_02670 [Candidatus Gottesmanbacteria bacterium]|nr:hypothetical protein [Candidatus Gottesmanbacteria bacterium]
MKPQDIIFFIIFFGLISQRKFEWLAVLGLFCIVLSIPLFSLWIFFTAERLTWYAALCIAVSAIHLLISLRHNEYLERKDI